MPPTDTVVLNFALTLEHLEAAFYTEGLSKLDAAAFADAGYPIWVRERFEQIHQHELSHVQLLSTALGSAATQACNYSFPFTDPKSFIALSMALEGTGTSAYTGAAQLISNKDTLTTAASILAVEARHDGWVSSAVSKGAAWNGPYDTALSVNGVFSIASQFITSCPSSNPALPVTPLPAFSIATTSPTAEQTISLKFTVPSAATSAGLYVAWFNGLDVLHSAVDTGKMTTVVPNGLLGTTYAGVVSTSGGAPSNQTLLTALSIVNFPLSSTSS
ncbi:ferritin-like domain-containing protein [Cytidiella melzeri]|nr:ferritin-like domain-containing protein [Cytidiella melzeri]